MRASRRLCAGGGYCSRDLWRYGGHEETADLRDVRRIGEGRGLRWGARKRVDWVSPGRPKSLRRQHRPVDDYSPKLVGMAQNGGTRGGTFHGEMNRCRESQGWTAACSSMPERVCPNVTERTNGWIAESKRIRAGALAIVV